MATIGQQVAEQVTRISTEISEQTDLISQMNTALDDLGAVAGGSGSGSVETCAMTVRPFYETAYGLDTSICYSTITENGNIEFIELNFKSTDIAEEFIIYPLKNSLFIVRAYGQPYRNDDQWILIYSEIGENVTGVYGRTIYKVGELDSDVFILQVYTSSSDPL